MAPANKKVKDFCALHNDAVVIAGGRDAAA
jgi:hypothetical protein